MVHIVTTNWQATIRIYVLQQRLSFRAAGGIEAGQLGGTCSLGSLTKLVNKYSTIVYLFEGQVNSLWIPCISVTVELLAEEVHVFTPAVRVPLRY